LNGGKRSSSNLKLKPMKKSSVPFIFLIIGFFVAAALLTSCGKKSAEQAGDEHHHTEDGMPMDSTQAAYACPMHPEVTGKEGEECSKCGMKLELAKSADSNTVTADTVKKSIPKEVRAEIGEAKIMIHYHAPAVRGRVIWGGLIPYGEVWVTGAHSATNLEFNKDIIINGKTITAGKYAFFTIPGKDNWTVIINKNWDQHLADEYDVKDDIIRVNVQPMSGNHQERLNYAITSNDSKAGHLTFAWEEVRVVLPFQIK
jgi:hypothetical protein